MRKWFNPNSRTYWDKKYLDQESRGVRRSDGKGLDKFKDHFKRADTILDFGSGRGGNVEYLSKRMKHKKFTLVDHSTVCLQQCRDMLEGDKSGNEFDFLNTLSGIEARSIDMIMSLEVLEHIPDYRNILQELWGLLKPGGALLVSVPVKGWRDRHREHINKFTLKTMFQELTRLSDVVQI